MYLINALVKYDFQAYLWREIVFTEGAIYLHQHK